jgi:hypothetical protein
MRRSGRDAVMAAGLAQGRRLAIPMRPE